MLIYKGKLNKRSSSQYYLSFSPYPLRLVARKLSKQIIEIGFHGVPGFLFPLAFPPYWTV